METLRLERDGPVGWLWLNRPEKLNSFTLQMWRELAELGEKLSRDDELRALVVIGEGRAFSSGIDTSVFTSSARDELRDDESPRHADPVVASVLRTQDAYTWLEEAPFATIAAVRGYALGAGLQLALACDVRIVAEGTKLGLLELKYGILPDLGGTQRLPRLVGPGKAKELIFTGVQIDAAEARRVGIAERVVADVDLQRDAAELAAHIAAQPPLAVRGVKRAVEAAATMPVREGLVVEAEAQAVCLQSDDMREAITAFVEQRLPRYHAR
ncbi:MAG: enoyl-CoA hydratase/isomerase family protein [Actinobacteria bacterium]|nr:enoyl-CoA hydratase/isomerase family protein [Actinomycetota bacterium]